MKNSLLPLIVLILFAGYTVFVMLTADQSLLDFGRELISSPDTAQVVIDLYIMVGLACVWMYHDNKSRGNSIMGVLPYFVLTAIFASIGPLLYLVLRPKKSVTNQST